MTHNPDSNDLGACMPLDKLFEGVKPGELVIIKGRQNIGKSWLLHELAERQHHIKLEMERQRGRAFDFMIHDELGPPAPVELAYHETLTGKAEDTTLRTRLKKAKEAKSILKPSTLLSNMLGRL